MVPFVSLATGVVFLGIAWQQRHRFSERPYFHWFLYLHMGAVGLHQFEEYGWPGGFRDFLAGIFTARGVPDGLVPPTTSLELLNAFGLTALFGLIGWLGTRVRWAGLALLFTNFANGYFHLVYAVTRFEYAPGVITSACLYLPLGLFAARFAVRNDDVNAPKLFLAFALGTFASFLPFLHIWVLPMPSLR